MLAVNDNRDDMSWVTSYPPYVTIELTTRPSAPFGQVVLGGLHLLDQ